MLTQHTRRHISGLPYRYGFALEEFVMPNGSIVVGHSGSTGGYSMMMFRIPAADTTLVTAVNTSDLFTNALEVFIPALEAISPAPWSATLPGAGAPPAPQRPTS